MPSWLRDALEWAGIIVGTASALTGVLPRATHRYVRAAQRVVSVASLLTHPEDPGTLRNPFTGKPLAARRFGGAKPWHEDGR